MKERKTISIPLLPLIVVAVATIWVGFAIGSVFITGAYIWLAVILGAGIVGGGVLYFTMAAETPRAPEIDELSEKQQTFESTLAEHGEQLQRLQGTSESTQQALQKFSLAMSEYAEQLRVHTAASKELNGAAQEQDKPLSQAKGATTEQPIDPQGEGNPTAQEYMTKAEYAEQLRINTAAIKDLGEASQELRQAAQEQSKVLSLMQESLAEETKSQGEIKALLRSPSGSGLGPGPPREHNEEVSIIPWGWQLGGAGMGTEQHREQKDGRPRIPWGWELGRFA